MKKVVRTFCSPISNGREELEQLLNEGWEIILATSFHRVDCIEYILEK